MLIFLYRNACTFNFLPTFAARNLKNVANLIDHFPWPHPSSNICQSAPSTFHRIFYPAYRFISYICPAIFNTKRYEYLSYYRKSAPSRDFGPARRRVYPWRTGSGASGVAFRCGAEQAHLALHGVRILPEQRFAVRLYRRYGNCEARPAGGRRGGFRYPDLLFRDVGANQNGHRPLLCHQRTTPFQTEEGFAACLGCR